jgi:hypothetical protein
MQPAVVACHSLITWAGAGALAERLWGSQALFSPGAAINLAKDEPKYRFN